MQRIFSLVIGIIAFFCVSNAQLQTPITWTTSLVMTSDNEGEIKFDAAIEDGWHLYALTLPEGGPNPTKIVFDTLDGVELLGEIIPSVIPTESVDMIFNLELGWWTSNVSLVQKFKLVGDGNYNISGKIACSMVIPPIVIKYVNILILLFPSM